MRNLLESFPTLNKNLIEKSGYKDKVKINYSKNNEIRDLKLKQIEEKKYYLDDDFCSWTPLEDNLSIEIKCTILDKNVLFDKNYGIADVNSILGLAINYYCKRTNKNVSKKIAEIKYDENEPKSNFSINLKFKKGELANAMGISIFLYLDKSYKKDMFANNSGTILGTYNEFEIFLEGNGSLFPIKIADEKNMPVWFAEFNYSDINEDLFEDKNICLYLNKNHADYKFLNAEGTSISPLMKEIVSEFIALFIEDVLNRESLEVICSNNYDEEQAIGNVAKYWIKSFNIKTTTSREILFSVKKIVDKILS